MKSDHFLLQTALVFTLCLLASFVSSAPAPSLSPADKQKAVDTIKHNPLLRAFCQFYLHGYRPPTVTSTATVISTSVVPSTTVTAVSYTGTTTVFTSTSTVTVGGGTAQTTVTQSYYPFNQKYPEPTQASSRRSQFDEESLLSTEELLAKRQISLPHQLEPYKLFVRDICASALYGQPTTTVSSTSTATVSSGIATTTTPAISTFSTVSTTTVTSTSTTVTSYRLNTAQPVGPPAPSGNSLFRIEGNDNDGVGGTIWEGYVTSGPRMITTKSGGTHNCDGTNNDANPSPGNTLIDAIDAAGKLANFGYDGTYESNFQDFFIQSIGNTAQTGNAFWGVLNNFMFTPNGGCEAEYGHSDQGFWAFNAFNVNGFLSLDKPTDVDFPNYTVGQSFVVTVQIYDGGGAPPTLRQGATITMVDANNAQVQTQTSGNDGTATFTVPSTPGVYQLKARQSDTIRSNAVVIAVSPAAS